jgi:Phage tail assembly chaperone
MSKTYGTRDAILELDDLQSEEVVVPEWGGIVVAVRSLSGTERDALEASMTQVKGKKTEVNFRNMRAKMVVRASYDQDGKRLFRDEDEAAVGRKNSAALQRIFEVAARLSGITASDVDELTKNSEEGQSEGSGSG